VIPTSYQELGPSVGASPASADLVLDADGPTTIDASTLRAGQCVRGPTGKRATVIVPRGGLVVGVEDVRFQDVDFVWDASGEPLAVAEAAPAIVELRAAGAEFRGCCFRSVRGAPLLPAAVRWTHPMSTADALLSLPSGRVRLVDCVLRDVAAAVDCHTAAALAVEFHNTLHVGGGPLVRLSRYPKPDEPIAIVLDHVTLREAGTVLHCEFASAEDTPAAGQIAIRSDAAVFAPRHGQPLILLGGSTPPERLLASIRWTGQGSLVDATSPIAVWQRPDGRQDVLDDASVAISGLIRSQLGFAGEAESTSSASRIIQWQAPLRSADPPGIDVTRLPDPSTEASTSRSQPGQ